MLQIALYGNNGHQIQQQILVNPRAQLVAIAGITKDSLPDSLQSDDLIVYSSLEELIKHPQLDLLSLCGPSRATQPQEIIQCLKAGIHCYAEKPTALTLTELEQVLAVSDETGQSYFEMAGSIFSDPYWSMRHHVLNGAIGEIVQVFCQKSYPLTDWRPHSESIDGGLTRQVGIHAIRFAEQITGLRLTELSVSETTVGIQEQGDLKRASNLQGRFSNGGLFCGISNYCNPSSFTTWGNDHIRLFGTHGFMESTDSGARTRLVLEDGSDTEIPQLFPSSYEEFDLIVDFLLDQKEFPIPSRELIEPTRTLLTHFSRS